MIHFHPDENLLAEYSAGTLDTGLAIAVKAHLSMCPKCASYVAELEQFGSMFFDHHKSSHENCGSELSSFKELMSKIKKLDENKLNAETKLSATPSYNHNRASELPHIVRKLVPDNGRLKWQFVSPSLKQARLATGQQQYEVCLHKIKKGGKVAEHDHRGVEVTVVLEGSFSDEGGRYHKGDFLLREPGETHRPTATQDQDCLCLSVVAAPVKLTGLLGKVLNPFLKVSPI